MRELKFRAWDKVKGKWIDGAYGFHILGEMMLIGGLFQDYKIEDLNNIIIEQFTGLKDKNGTEIYEGDIVAWWYSRIKKICFMDVVMWSSEKAGWILKEHPAHRIDLFTPEKNLEVIDNIHENPELLI